LGEVNNSKVMAGVKVKSPGNPKMNFEVIEKWRPLLGGNNFSKIR